jgi:hypothetical protein
MGTTDGISTKDWDLVHELAVDIVNAPDGEKAQRRYQLLGYLEKLEAKYGSLPSILATRADNLDREDPAREDLLLKAHALAGSRSDIQNIILTTQSLAELCLERRRLADADRWLTRLREYLVGCNDSYDWREYERLRAEYRRLAISPAQ